MVTITIPSIFVLLATLALVPLVAYLVILVLTGNWRRRWPFQHDDHRPDGI
jgi:hypothetical protein